MASHVILTPEVGERIDKALRRMPIRVPAEIEFGKGSGHADFLPAPQLYDLAVRLIHQHNPHFAHLVPLRLACLWKRRGGKNQGLAVFGKCERPSGLARFFSGFEGEDNPVDFVIWLAADHCREDGWGQEELEALLYHELCHTGWDEEKCEPVLVAHDFEGFRDEIERYGFWKPSFRALAETVQLQLPSPADQVTGMSNDAP